MVENSFLYLSPSLSRQHIHPILPTFLCCLPTQSPDTHYSVSQPSEPCSLLLLITQKLNTCIQHGGIQVDEHCCGIPLKKRMWMISGVSWSLRTLTKGLTLIGLWSFVIGYESKSFYLIGEDGKHQGEELNIHISSCTIIGHVTPKASTPKQ